MNSQYLTQSFPANHTICFTSPIHPLFHPLPDLKPHCSSSIILQSLYRHCLLISLHIFFIFPINLNFYSSSIQSFLLYPCKMVQSQMISCPQALHQSQVILHNFQSVIPVISSLIAAFPFFSFSTFISPPVLPTSSPVQSPYFFYGRLVLLIKPS